MLGRRQNRGYATSKAGDGRLVIGNLPFQSPEGAVGEHVDARADLYAVALVLYVMLAGRGPFDHVDDSMILLAHAQETPEPPSRYAADPVPVELDTAILRGLSKDPNQRFQTAEEFRAVLSGIGQALGQPAAWLETTAHVIDDGPPDGSSALIAAGTPASGVRLAEPADSGWQLQSPGSEHDQRPGLSRRAHTLIFIATALVTAAIATTLAFVLRGAP